MPETKAPERYFGPCDLPSALNGSRVDSLDIQVAVSCPDGDWIALRRRGKITCRRVLKQSGRAGSVLETGECVSPDQCPVRSWRPA